MEFVDRSVIVLTLFHVECVCRQRMYLHHGLVLLLRRYVGYFGEQVEFVG